MQGCASDGLQNLRRQAIGIAREDVVKLWSGSLCCFQTRNGYSGRFAGNLHRCPGEGRRQTQAHDPAYSTLAPDRRGFHCSPVPHRQDESDDRWAPGKVGMGNVIAGLEQAFVTSQFDVFKEG